MTYEIRAYMMLCDYGTAFSVIDFALIGFAVVVQHGQLGLRSDNMRSSVLLDRILSWSAIIITTFDIRRTSEIALALALSNSSMFSLISTR